MTTEKRKALLRDVRDASNALGRIVDGGHDLSQLPKFPSETLESSALDMLFGLAILDARLTAEIGTDNL